VVIKLYRWEVRPKPEIVEKLGAISRECVVEVYERGVLPDGRHYEVLEHICHGSLADLARGGLAEPTVRLTLEELTKSVTALHAVDILHRDLKPSNILVRALEPLVLIDFGISSVAEISLHVTSVNRTAAYSAPEALTSVVSRASDWWSIGVILLELLTGRRLFEGIEERGVNFALVTRGIVVPDNLPNGCGMLIRGLLTQDHAQRWGEEQVRAWLSGKRDMPVRYNNAASEPLTAGRTHKPYKFKGREYPSPAELAVALAEHPDDGMKHLGRGFLTQWVKDEVKDFDLTCQLMDVFEDEGLTAEQRLSVAVLAMNPQLPLTWRGEIVNPDWLAGNPDAAVRLLKGSVSNWVEKLCGDRWLSDLQRRRSQLWADLKQFELSLDIRMTDLMTDLLILAGESKVRELAGELRRQYAGSSDSQVNSLYQREPLSHPEAIALVAYRRELLMTNEQLCIAAVRCRAEELGAAVRQRAQQMGVALELEEIARVIGLDEQVITSEVFELRKCYIDSTNAYLSGLLHGKESTREDLMVLLSCQRDVFIPSIQEVQSRLRNVVTAYRSRISDPNVFFHPDIPPAKLRNALSTYATGARRSREQVFLLYDYTILGNAKDGFLITERGLFFRGAPGEIALSEIRSVSLIEQRLLDKLNVNGTIAINLFKAKADGRRLLPEFIEKASEVARR
jgi:serine/threonine protein kinase